MSFQFTLNAIRFEDVRAEVVKFLSEQGTYDAQFDFAGSNLAYVIDTMAYTTMLMSYMLSTVANDNFLDTTTLRKNAVSIAKTLGYKPKRIQGSRIEGTFTYRPGDVVFNSESRLTIPPNTVFTGTDEGYTWVNTEPIILRVNPKDPFELTTAADPATPRISIIQGTWRKFDYLGNGKNLQSFTIPSTKIDENNMKVSVYTTQDNESTKTEWIFARTFFQIQGDEIYFIEEDIIQEGSPKIIFGNGIVGRAPAVYETVTVDYLEVLGARANGESDLDIPETLVMNKSFDIASVDVSNLNFVPAGPSFGGKEFETLDSIKANAPRFFAAAGRAVTSNDFVTLVENEFDYLVDQVAVFGGDELEPGNRLFLGNSYITATPEAGDAETSFTDSLQLYLTESGETEIITKLKDAGVIATEKYFLKPSYMYLQIEPTIEVSSEISSAELEATETQSFDVLEKYFEDEYKGFGVPYRESKARSQVDTLENVISTDLDTDYAFILNRDSFYTNRSTTLWLPVKFQRDSEGRVVRNDQGYPETNNFIKTNNQIATDYDAGNRSLLELYRITVDADGMATADKQTTVWHGRDTLGDLDAYWAPSLDAGSFRSSIDFNLTTLDTTSGQVLTFEMKDTGVEFATASYGPIIPADDSTTIAAGIKSAIDSGYPEVTATIDATDSGIIHLDYYRNHVVASDDTSIDSTAFLDSGVGQIQLDELLPASYQDSLQFWTMNINETAVAQIFVEDDRGINTVTLPSAIDFLEDEVEVRSNFETKDAEPLNNIPYNTISIRRWYSKSKGLGVLPETVDGVIKGKTAIHGALATPDLDRYLFNNDSAEETVAELIVLLQSGNKSLFQETFSFKGTGSNFYTTSLSWSFVDENNNNQYSLYFNNTISDERKKVSTLVWDKTESGVDQFTFVTNIDEAQWLQNQGFFVKEATDGTATVYEAFSITVDETGKYSIDITLASGISALKVDEKNLMMAWTYDGTTSTPVDSYTREFTDLSGTKVPLTITDNGGTLEVTWDTVHLFDIAVDSTEYTGFKATIVDEDDFRSLGLRTEIRIEPLNLFTVDPITNAIVEKDGFAVFVYGVYHNSVIGTFEYENGDAIFNTSITGNYLGGVGELETATISIRDFFDNYGTGDDDIQMDIITIVPDNVYEIIDGEEVIVGSETDFDSVFTQTIRADILPVKSVLI